MKINTSSGNFTIIQTRKNQDELLILGSWSDIVRHFGSTRVFLINSAKSSFGIYVCKQECAEFMSQLIKNMDSNDWEDFSTNLITRNVQSQSA